MAKNAFITFISNIFVLLIRLITSIVLARSLGPNLVGIFFLLTVTTITLERIINMGINISNSTLAAKDHSKMAALNTYSLFISVGVGIIMFMIYLPLRGTLQSTIFVGVDPFLITLSVLGVPITMYSTYWSSIMLGLNRIVLINVVQIIYSLFILAAYLCILLIFKLGLREVIIATLVIVALNAFVLLLYSILKDKFRPAFDTAVFKEMVSLGFRGHLGNIAHFVFLRLGYFLINPMVGSTALGYYGVATNWAERIRLAIRPVYTAALPRITSASKEESAMIVAKLMRSLLLVLIILSLTFAIVSPFLINILYGEEFLSAVVPMVILLVGVIFFGSSWFMGLFFIGQLKRPEVTTKIAWIGLAISIPLYLSLINLYGIIGAAAASSITYIFIFIATLIQFKKESRFGLRQIVIISKGDFIEMKKLLFNYFKKTKVRFKIFPQLKRYLCRS